MTTNWLATTAIVISIGAAGGVAFAQTQPDLPQRHEEGARAPHQSLSPREGGRSAASEERQMGGARERAAQSAPNPARQAGRGETSPLPHQQAQERRPSDNVRQTIGEGRERSGPAQRPLAGTAQQDQDKRNGREAQQALQPSRQQGRDREAIKQGNRAAESAKSETTKSETSKSETSKSETSKSTQPGPAQREQQTGRNERQPANAARQSQNQQQRGRGAERAAEKQQPAPVRNQQAAEPSRSATPTAQQGTSPAAQTTGEARGRETTGQAQNQATTGRAATASSTRINDQQRTQIVDSLRRDKGIERARTDVNIRVNVGERLPERVRPRPLPTDIVSIVPEYRGYDYTVVQDEIAIVDPRSREIVDVIPERGYTAENSRYEGTRVVLSSEQRQILKRTALSSMTVGSTASSTASNTACLTLRPVPDELVRSNPELASYRYVAIGDQVVLVDPRERKIVQVIE